MVKKLSSIVLVFVVCIQMIKYIPAYASIESVIEEAKKVEGQG